MGLLINLADRVDVEKEDTVVTERMNNAEQKKLLLKKNCCY